MNGWIIASLVWIVLGLAFRSWVLLGAFGGLLLLSAIGWVSEHYYLARAQVEDLDAMTGWEFERWLQRLFERLGFDVKRTPYHGDFGADLVLTWNGVKIAVQAKRSQRQVGVTAVQEVVAAKGYYGCECAMVVTNGYFTEQAVILARANGVWMRTRDDLAKALSSLGETSRTLAASPVKSTTITAQ
jgi:restriction system protein